MLYKVEPGDNLNTVAKKFGYDDISTFFKTMRYVGGGSMHAFIPGAIIECPSSPTTSRDRAYNDEDGSLYGSRGKRFVEGLTMRDVADCFTLAIGAGISEQLTMDQSDWLDNFASEIEKMMGDCNE